MAHPAKNSDSAYEADISDDDGPMHVEQLPSKGHGAKGLHIQKTRRPTLDMTTFEEPNQDVMSHRRRPRLDNGSQRSSPLPRKKTEEIKRWIETVELTKLEQLDHHHEYSSKNDRERRVRRPKRRIAPPVWNLSPALYSSRDAYIKKPKNPAVGDKVRTQGVEYNGGAINDSLSPFPSASLPCIQIPPRCFEHMKYSEKSKDETRGSFVERIEKR